MRRWRTRSAEIRTTDRISPCFVTNSSATDAYFKSGQRILAKAFAVFEHSCVQATSGKGTDMIGSRSYCPFPNTHWSLVKQAGVEDRDARKAAMTVLLQRYQPALRSYLVAVRRLPSAAVEDILQSFLADKLLEQRFLQYAEAGRGKFRTFLLTSLNNYVSSYMRKSRVRLTKPLDNVNNPDAQPNPSRILEAAWARTLVLNVLQVMREECFGTERSDVWVVFEGRLLFPIFQDRDPRTYEALAKDLHLQSPTQAANLLVTAKRMYARLLRKAVGEYERNDRDISDEISELRSVLGQGVEASFNWSDIQEAPE